MSAPDPSSSVGLSVGDPRAESLDQLAALRGTEIDRRGDRPERRGLNVAQVSQIRCFSLSAKDLDHDDDEVAATIKVCRVNVHKKYRAEFERLYGYWLKSLASNGTHSRN